MKGSLVGTLLVVRRFFSIKPSYGIQFTNNVGLSSEILSKIIFY